MEGGKYPRTTQQEGYRKVIEPDEWKSSIEVTETMVEDATLFDVKGRMKDFMLSYTRTREKFGATLLNNGYNTTATFAGKTFNIAGADELALFDAAHTSKTGETANQSNAANDLPFSYDNLCIVEERMQGFKDDNGNLLNIQPDTIIIPNNARIKKLVFDAVATEKGAPNTANNSFNYNFGRWNVVIWNQLTNPSSATHDIWFLMDSQRNQIDGLVWLDRVPLSVRSWIDNETGNNVFGGRARFGCAPVNWRVIYGCFPGVTL